MEDIEDLKKQNIGNAGEYYVAALLSARNYTTTLTLGRAERYDIIAVVPNGKTFKFSVKTRFKQEGHYFTLSERDEKKPENDLFYILVRLHSFQEEPEFWVIPSKRVSTLITTAHKKWLRTPGRHGQAHNNSSVRKIPIELRGADTLYYPKNWPKEMKKYYKNFDILR